MMVDLDGSFQRPYPRPILNEISTHYKGSDTPGNNGTPTQARTNVIYLKLQIYGKPQVHIRSAFYASYHPKEIQKWKQPEVHSSNIGIHLSLYFPETGQVIHVDKAVWVEAYIKVADLSISCTERA